MGSPALRVTLHRDQKGKCHYCSIQMTMEVKGVFFCTVDHKKVRSKGGTSRRENVVGACFRCNNLRGDIPYEAFKWYTEEYGPVSIKETLKGLSRFEYSRNREMWDAIHKKVFRPREVPIPLPQVEAVVPHVLTEPFKPRRAILHLTRRNLVEIVNKMPFDQRNILWGRYLKQEKLNEQSRSAGTDGHEGTADDPKGSGSNHHHGGWFTQPDYAVRLGAVQTGNGHAGGDLPAPA